MIKGVYLWKPIPFILSSLSSTSSTDLRRHTSAISCFDKACWGLACEGGFSPLHELQYKDDSIVSCVSIIPHTEYGKGSAQCNMKPVQL